MKTLIIKYTPREESSNTKKLLDSFLSQIKDVEILDLAKDLPQYFNNENLTAYYKRNFGGVKLSEDEKNSIEHMDNLVKQFKEADKIVLATPMFNFSLPGAVKSYFDAIIFKGETWEAGENGFYGLIKDKKALILMTAGGNYSEGDYKELEFGAKLAKTLFNFMGIQDVQINFTQSLNMVSPEQANQLIEESKENLVTIAKTW